MPHGALCTVLVACMLLQSLDNQLVDVIPYKERMKSELTEHYFL